MTLAFFQLVLCFDEFKMYKFCFLRKYKYKITQISQVANTFICDCALWQVSCVVFVSFWSIERCKD